MTTERLFRGRMHPGTTPLPALPTESGTGITFGLASRPIVLASLAGSYPVRASTPWAIPSDGTWRLVAAETTDLHLVHSAGLPVRVPALGTRLIRFDGPDRKVMRAAIKSMTPSWIDDDGQQVADLAPYGPEAQHRARLRPVHAASDHDTVAAFVMMASWALERNRSIADQRLERVLAHIDQHLADPGLTTASIATRTRLSRRTLQGLFSTHGGLAAHIRRRRVVAAVGHLVADPGAFPDLDEVAHATGLGSRRTLERAMRHVYGLTPGQAREHVLSGEVLRERQAGERNVQPGRLRSTA
ncbi:AraC family transcriptional regulator [Nocardioides marmoriginsengisoli]|uniref:AraC family transcriptional regulator n=1 Tax=Nocardioides marmoriginsengisoli TaxID=661483 RepID=A0A3N0CFS4_9ACTN|nr:helix-turn-helix domain-containing protein [Nocardioides marmoriginsengisoli]RNL62312.1 AraC family transcriptional regulator [Nocardioides marmoriginsengisoli]